MSSGIGHMCKAMGIAEPIAINTMVTANIFAMFSHRWPIVVGHFIEMPQA
jgi:hypothetical protein